MGAGVAPVPLLGGRGSKDPGPSPAGLRSRRTLPSKPWWSVTGPSSELHEDPRAFGPGPGVLPRWVRDPPGWW